MRRRFRDSMFRLARKDIIEFIDDHEEEIMRVFRQEMYRLDRQIPEENLYIDIRVVELGEEILKAVLQTVKRVMLEI